MAIRDIVKIGDDLLRQRSKEITIFDERLGLILDDMKETMESRNGAGLAAVQIGILKRMAVCDDGETFLEMINPVIESIKGEECMEEGCLSIPNVHARVVRPRTLMLKAYDRHGVEFRLKAEGFMARAICHEIDHMDGVLFVDKAQTD